MYWWSHVICIFCEISFLWSCFFTFLSEINFLQTFPMFITMNVYMHSIYTISFKTRRKSREQNGQKTRYRRPNPTLELTKPNLKTYKTILKVNQIQPYNLSIQCLKLTKQALQFTNKITTSYYQKQFLLLTKTILTFY